MHTVHVYENEKNHAGSKLVFRRPCRQRGVKNSSTCTCKYFWVPLKQNRCMFIFTERLQRRLLRPKRFVGRLRPLLPGNITMSRFLHDCVLLYCSYQPQSWTISVLLIFCVWLFKRHSHQA